MNQLGTRISFKNYPKAVQQKGRRTLIDESREFGRNITNLLTTRDQKQTSTDTSCPKTQRTTLLRIRSVSINGKNRVVSSRSETHPYAKEITKSMLNGESLNSQLFPINTFQMKLRTLTIDWIIDVHSRLQLKDQTLFLFFQYFDEYCGITEIPKTRLRHVALTCLWMASKYEEIHSPRIRNFFNVTDGITTIQQMKTTQYEILQKLQYKMLKTTPLQLAYLILGDRKGTSHQSFCKFLLQLYYAFNLNSKYRASVFIVAAFHMIQQVYKEKTQYRKFKQQFQIDNQELVQCFKQVCVIFEKSSTEVNITSLKRKYQKSKNHEVGKIKFEFKEAINN